MADLNVKYSRAENGIDSADIDSGAEMVDYVRHRNGLSKLEKFLLASTLILVFVSSVFAALYMSERQTRNLMKETSSSENEDKNCKASNATEEEKQNKTSVMSSCDLNPNSANCVNEVIKQAAFGKMSLITMALRKILFAVFLFEMRSYLLLKDEVSTVIGVCC